MKRHAGLWQTRLGRCIFATPQGHQVWQNPLHRWLTFDSAPVQSIIHRYQPQKPVTACIDTMGFAFRQRPGSLLLLGLGGASVAHALQPFRTEAEWTLVEYDSEVLTIAHDYFQTERLQPCRTEQADALTFIRQDNQRYDHILIDLADASQFPPHCATPLFFESCQQRLNDKGLLTLNMHNPRQHRSLFTMVKTLFPATLLFPIPAMANMVLLAGKDSSPSELLASLRATTHCRQLYWNRDWGMMAGL